MWQPYCLPSYRMNRQKQVQVTDAVRVRDSVTSFDPWSKRLPLKFLLKEVRIGCLQPKESFSLKGQCAQLLRACRAWQLPEARFAVWAEHWIFWEILTILNVTTRFYVEICFSKEKGSLYFLVTAVIFSAPFCFSSFSHPHSTFWMRGGKGLVIWQY